MKSTVLLFSLCILCTSCYSYKTTIENPSEVTTGVRHHFDLKNGKEFIRKIDSIGADVYYVSKNRKVEMIPFSEVSLLEQGTFSTGRTIGFSGLATVGAAAILAIIVFLTGY